MKIRCIRERQRRAGRRGARASFENGKARHEARRNKDRSISIVRISESKLKQCVFDITLLVLASIASCDCDRYAPKLNE